MIGLAVQDIIILYKVLFRRLCPLQKRERQTIDQRLQRANLGLRHLGRMLVRIVLIFRFMGTSIIQGKLSMFLSNVTWDIPVDCVS